MPVDALLVQSWDAYWWERSACTAAQRCDFVLVNLFREPLGVPMRPGAINELLMVLSHRAGLDRQIHPHMLRHAFAGDVLDSGGALNEVQYLLGRASTIASALPASIGRTDARGGRTNRLLQRSEPPVTHAGDSARFPR